MEEDITPIITPDAFINKRGNIKKSYRRLLPRSMKLRIKNDYEFQHPQHFSEFGGMSDDEIMEEFERSQMIQDELAGANEERSDEKMWKALAKARGYDIGSREDMDARDQYYNDKENRWLLEAWEKGWFE